MIHVAKEHRAFPADASLSYLPGISSVVFFLNVDIILCKCFSILCACKKFMCCEELFSKRPVHSLFAYVRKNLPLYTPPPHFSHKNTCNCLFMRRSSKKVATRSMHIFFLILYHLCGSYYVHSNIVNIKGSIQACF